MMRGLHDNGPTEAVDALLGWWSLAGVECSVDEIPVNWLRPVAVPVARPKISHEALREAPLPETLDGFHQWLGQDHRLQEAGWAGPRILPTGNSGAAVMVICDMPEMEDGPEGRLLSGEAGILFDAMLGALSLSRAEVYLASLAIARPPGGLFSAEDEASLASRMRQQIALAAPQRAILMGEKTNRALSAADASAPEIGLRTLNHAHGTVNAVAIRHPRFLLRQPAAKAQTWLALQDLIEDPTE
jgi:DNA polymerase